MIAAVARVGWLELRRDPVALALTLVLPIVFFSVFAGVFGGTSESGDRPVDAIVIDLDGTPRSSRFEEFLRTERSLRIVSPEAWSRDRDPVAAGLVPVAIVIREGFGTSFPPSPAEPAPIEIRADTSHPVAARVATGAVRQAAIRLGLDGLVGSSEAPVNWVETVDVLGGPGRDPAVSFFAAGLGVMFLLFAVSGRAAILIEERESGVLDRLLSSGLGLTRLMIGRWLFLTALGAVQVFAMFAWGSFAFGLDLWTPRHLAGFVPLTAVTAATAAAFGLVLASVCRTRAQLNGVAAVTILILSAVGGSLFPRFLMPEAMRTFGLVAFNAWALDGYRKVFWYQAEPYALAPQLAVLAASCVAFLAIARVLVARGTRA